MKLVLRHNIIFLLLLILTGVFGTAYSADQETIRVRIGLKLFRAIMAADMQINTKQDIDGTLVLAIIYKNNPSQAILYSEKLQNLGKGKNQGKIKGIPIIVHAIGTDHLEQLSTHHYAGIYIVEDIDSTVLQQVVKHGIDHHIISYSPFSGAVEQGVSAGLVIEARVKPYVNLQTLKRSQLEIKTFFLKVSKHYEP